MPERNDPEYYADRARRCRMLARLANDADIRKVQERMAESYEELAATAKVPRRAFTVFAHT